MADIDDDLLDLAGGDSGDEGSINESRSRPGSSPPAKKGPAKKAKRRARNDDSEEEGEASSRAGTPNSLESAPMDESDSDDDAPRNGASGADDEKYPVEGMYISHAEKAEIMAMPELEREQIIADRMTEIDRQRQNRLLRQMVENEERKTKKKRSADAADLEDGARTTSRQKTGKGGSAMESLRRAREEKAKRRENADKRRGSYSPLRDSPEPEASDDDFRRDGSRTPEAEAKDAPPPELKDFERVRLGRNEFAQVCFTPGFESAITGCYIRIALGPHPETGIEQYRMCVIKGFTTSRPYALSGPNGTFVTDQYVRAAHGKAIKEFPFIAASSGRFSENELHRYTMACQVEGVTMPTKAFLNDKVEDINSLINHSWTNEEIKARLARKNELRKRFDPQERARVARLLEEARERGDDEKVEEYQETLDKMGSQRLAFRTTLGPTKSADSTRDTEQDRLAERNRENRRLNQEAVRKAQLKEKARAREIEEALERGEQVNDDPSRRVKTRAKFIHDVNEKSEKAAGASQSGTATPNGTPKATTKSMPAHLAKLQLEKHAESTGVPTIHKPLQDDDVIGALDLDIDVEV